MEGSNQLESYENNDPDLTWPSSSMADDNIHHLGNCGNNPQAVYLKNARTFRASFNSCIAKELHFNSSKPSTAGPSTVEYELGIYIIELAFQKGIRAFEIKVRHDVNESVLLGVSEQVLTMLGKDVHRRAFAAAGSLMQPMDPEGNHSNPLSLLKLCCAPYLEVQSDLSTLSALRSSQAPFVKTTTSIDESDDSNKINGSTLSSTLLTFTGVAQAAVAAVAFAAGASYTAMDSWEYVRVYLGVKPRSMARVLLVVISPAPGAVSLSVLPQRMITGLPTSINASQSVGNIVTTAAVSVETNECDTRVDTEFQGTDSLNLTTRCDRLTKRTEHTTEFMNSAFESGQPLLPVIIKDLVRRPGAFNVFADSLMEQLVAALQAEELGDASVDLFGDAQGRFPSEPDPSTHMRPCNAQREKEEAMKIGREDTEMKEEGQGEGEWKEYKEDFDPDPGASATAVLPATESQTLVYRVASQVLRYPELRDAATLAVLPVDPHYVRDLQAIATRRMMKERLRLSAQLDRYVSRAEQQCAKLMTLLKPTFVRAELVVPPTPTPMTTSSTKVVLQQGCRYRCTSLTEVTVESGKAVLEAARMRILKHAQEEIKRDMVESVVQQKSGIAHEIFPQPQPGKQVSADQSESPTTTTTTASLSSSSLICSSASSFPFINYEDPPAEIAVDSNCNVFIDPSSSSLIPLSADTSRILCEVLVCAVKEELEQWCVDEMKEWLRWKQSCVTQRIECLDAYRMQLLRCLHSRPINSMDQSKNMKIEKGPSLGSAADRVLMASLRSKCRILTDDEPLLLETSASYKGRAGTLYITAAHVYFHAFDSSVVVASLVEGLGSFLGSFTHHNASSPAPPALTTSKATDTSQNMNRSTKKDSSTSTSQKASEMLPTPPTLPGVTTNFNLNFSMKLIPVRTIASVSLGSSSGDRLPISAIWPLPTVAHSHSSSSTITSSAKTVDMLLSPFSRCDKQLEIRTSSAQIDGSDVLSQRQGVASSDIGREFDVACNGAAFEESASSHDNDLAEYVLAKRELHDMDEIKPTATARQTQTQTQTQPLLHSLCIVDEGGNETSFDRIIGPSPDHCARVADLIHLLVLTKLYQIRNPSALRPSSSCVIDEKSEDDGNIAVVSSSHLGSDPFSIAGDKSQNNCCRQSKDGGPLISDDGDGNKCTGGIRSVGNRGTVRSQPLQPQLMATTTTTKNSSGAWWPFSSVVDTTVQSSSPPQPRMDNKKNVVADATTTPSPHALEQKVDTASSSSVVTSLSSSVVTQSQQLTCHLADSREPQVEPQTPTSTVPPPSSSSSSLSSPVSVWGAALAMARAAVPHLGGGEREKERERGEERGTVAPTSTGVNLASVTASPASTESQAYGYSYTILGGDEKYVDSISDTSSSIIRSISTHSVAGSHSTDTKSGQVNIEEKQTNSLNNNSSNDSNAISTPEQQSEKMVNPDVSVGVTGASQGGPGKGKKLAKNIQAFLAQHQGASKSRSGSSVTSPSTSS